MDEFAEMFQKLVELLPVSSTAYTLLNSSEFAFNSELFTVTWVDLPRQLLATDDFLCTFIDLDCHLPIELLNQSVDDSYQEGEQYVESDSHTR